MYRTVCEVGATNAMRLEAVAKDGRKAVLKYAHEDLEVCVGIATAAFAMATLRGEVSATYLHRRPGASGRFPATSAVQFYDFLELRSNVR